METFNYLNPGQTAVFGLYQPLYAIAKRIQWLLPNDYDHRKVVLMLGALHIEMVMLGCLGDLLEDSGWTVALSNSGIISPGNDALLTGHDAKYMHQVAALALNQLMVSSYDKYIESKSSTDPPNFGEWKTIMESAYSQFPFWSTVLNMQLDYLISLRLIRTEDCTRYHWKGSCLGYLHLIVSITHVGYHFITEIWKPYAKTTMSFMKNS